MNQVLLLLGAICLGAAAYLIYLQVPRRGHAPPAWLASDTGSTAAALGSFSLLIAGISFLVKAV